ncbi:MAG: ATP-binding protein [Denitrovibrio sp.]|nr:MAG: ATP-binding protein [Denitrovibrio sp.]
MCRYEDVTPNPEYLIKSVAEQGYSLEAALADLIDNSISAVADKIEILIKTAKEPFTLILADNGHGMDEETLKKSMRFPCTSPDNPRTQSDLGRFGLGMKTASFSQTRKFTVLSKNASSLDYKGRTWDLNTLTDHGWKLIINTQEEIYSMTEEYTKMSNEFLDPFQNFKPNTIIIWHGLYKYEEYLEESNRSAALKKEITETTAEHLSLVFHKYMEDKKGPLKIRLNNSQLEPFNPFPVQQSDFRPIEPKHRKFGPDYFNLEGYILPNRSIEESKNAGNIWTTTHRSLIDMEGIYIYRSKRVIYFGGWSGVIKKLPRLQLARLKIDIGNGVDNLLHLNVAKSKVIIPHDLKDAIKSYIEELKAEATKEFFNKGTTRLTSEKCKNSSLFVTTPSSKGMLLELNTDFPLIRQIIDNLPKNETAKFTLLIKMVNTQINKIKHTHDDTDFQCLAEEEQKTGNEQLKIIMEIVQNSGMDKNVVRKELLPMLGYDISSLPKDIIGVLYD